MVKFEVGPYVYLSQLIVIQTKLSEIDVSSNINFLQLIVRQTKDSEIDVGSHVYIF